MAPKKDIQDSPSISDTWRRFRDYLQLYPSGSFGRMFRSFFNALNNLFPSRKLFVIGVVGSGDNTIVADFIHHILFSAKKRVGTLSAYTIRINEEVQPVAGLTFGAELLQKFLAFLQREKTDYAIIALSWNDLKKQAYLYTNFDLIVITGLAATEKEELETQDQRRELINLLLEHTALLPKKYGIQKTLVLNADDEETKKFSLKRDYRILGYASSTTELERGELFVPDNASRSPYELTITVAGETYETSMAEERGLSATLAVLAVAKALYLSLEEIGPYLKTFVGTPGHREQIFEGQPFSIIVDNPATSDELRHTFSLARSLEQGKEFSLMLCVVSGEKTDAPEFLKEKGAIAAEYCNRIFITTENPYEDDPLPMLNTIEGGLPNEVRDKRSDILYWKVKQRRRAIEGAIETARAQDVILITGKINKEWKKEFEGETMIWDERRVIKEAIEHMMIEEKKHQHPTF